jgi:DNA polymerase-3 subunit delta
MAAKSSSNSKSDAVPHAFDFLEKKGDGVLPSVVVCFGPDDFLRRRCILRAIEFGGLQADLIRSMDGDDTDWRDVHDELATRSLFDMDGHKVARIRNGDKFVTKYREQLERWIEQGTTDATLLMDVASLPGNTRIYKLVKQHGWLVSCTEAADGELQKWITRWGRSQYGLTLTKPQSETLVQRIGPVCGLIDCELAKLALFADDQGAVSDARVSELVGGWRTETVWNLADAVAEGRVESSLEAIDKLFMAGQSAFGVAAQLSWSLRRYGIAAQLVEQSERLGNKPSLPQALEGAGFRGFELGKAELRLRRIGRQRAKDILSWLVELELQLKGSHSNEDRARLALESFLLKLADLQPSAAGRTA